MKRPMKRRLAEVYNFYVIKYNLSDDTLVHYDKNPFYDCLGQRTWTSVERTEGEAMLRFMAWHGQDFFVKVHSITIRDYHTRMCGVA